MLQCFGDAAVQDLDMDFERTLALFDKAAVFCQSEERVRHSSRPQHRCKGEQRPVRYQHRKNILEGKCHVPTQHGGKEFCTGEMKTNTHSTCLK